MTTIGLARRRTVTMTMRRSSDGAAHVFIEGIFACVVVTEAIIASRLVGAVVEVFTLEVWSNDVLDETEAAKR